MEQSLRAVGLRGDVVVNGFEIGLHFFLLLGTQRPVGAVVP
jgi:hypothetical protein